jgi:hypothetical protein
LVCLVVFAFVNASGGVNYLHLRSRAGTNDGFLVESVKVTIKEGAILIETLLRKK